MKGKLLIESIMKELITEAVQSSRVITSIKNRTVNKIYFDGDETMRPGYRSIEIYAYGKSYAGNDVIRAWQRGGVSDTPHGDGHDKLKEIPGWRLFNVAGIEQFDNTIQKFDASEDFMSRERPNYNAHDKQMRNIYYALVPDKGKTSTTASPSTAPTSTTTSTNTSVNNSTSSNSNPIN